MVSLRILALNSQTVMLCLTQRDYRKGPLVEVEQNTGLSGGGGQQTACAMKVERGNTQDEKVYFHGEQVREHREVGEKIIKNNDIKKKSSTKFMIGYKMCEYRYPKWVANVCHRSQRLLNNIPVWFLLLPLFPQG